jgi:hypothetical protein
MGKVFSLPRTRDKGQGSGVSWRGYSQYNNACPPSRRGGCFVPALRGTNPLSVGQRLVICLCAIGSLGKDCYV